MSGPQFMPLFVGDYLADTGHLNAAENGAYLLLIMHYWRTGSLPDDDDMRRRISRMTHREWQRSRNTILAFFSTEGKHKRIDEELSRAAHLSAVQSAKALKMHNARRAAAEQQECLLQPQPHLEENDSSGSKDPSEFVDAGGADPPAPIEDLPKISKPKPSVNGAELRFLGEQWNAMAGVLHLPQIDEIKSGSQRERHAIARLRDMAAGDGIEAGTIRLMAKIRDSPFLRGDEKTWRATFDWTMNQSNFTKILDGNYDEDRRKRR